MTTNHSQLSLLSTSSSKPKTWVVGAMTTFFAHALIPLTIYLVGYFFGLSPSASTLVRPVEEETIVSAKFVQLGEKPKPNRLPDKQVPPPASAPPPPSTSGATANPQPNDPQKKRDPKKKTENLLDQLGSRAETFAEIDKQRKLEGSPDGIAEGTVKKEQAGNLYAGKLYVFFRRGWAVPTIISDIEKEKLSLHVDIDLRQDLRLGGFRIRKSSGNRLFDQSVIDHLTRIKDARTELPKPPVEIEDEYLGHAMTLRFKGRDAQ